MNFKIETFLSFSAENCEFSFFNGSDEYSINWRNKLIRFEMNFHA